MDTASTSKGSAHDNGQSRYTIGVGGSETSLKQRVRSKDKKKKEEADGWYYLGVCGQIGFAIALPLAGGAIIGKFADAEWHTYPRYTMTGLGVGVILSLITFMHTIQEVLERR